MNNEFGRAEDAYLLEPEEPTLFKDEWIQNWLEDNQATTETLWEAFNEQPINEAMSRAYNTRDLPLLGLYAEKMIRAHMRELAEIAYDERMT